LFTKGKGDISECAVCLEAMKRGWEVLKPFGDKLPYDLVFDVSGFLVKIQVKSAWITDDSKVWAIESRRTKTNRRSMIKAYYKKSDFDFAVIHAIDPNVFWILPVKEFLTWKGQISFRLDENGQRHLKSNDFRNDWDLISKWASDEEIYQRKLLKFGETCNVAIPSQAC